MYKATGNDRKTFEKGNQLIYYLEFSKRKDFIFHRNSGMNQVLAKIAKQKHDIIGFSFSDWIKSENKAIVFGRMQQNNKLCKKYKVKTQILSFEKEDATFLKSFDRLLTKKKLY